MPLVSILIPAYNTEETIAQTLDSAIEQTWQRKEIIVVDDGSTDRTAEVVRNFGAKVTLVSTENQGGGAARNHALSRCEGDYIQWLDADDILEPHKIERQLATLHKGERKRILLSSPWASFYYRTHRARFIPNSLWQDLSPVEWFLRKMSENLHMQTATWLTSRELVEAAGPWDEHLRVNQDGEYFARVLLASEGTRFVPGTGVFYRATGRGSVSYLDGSDKKRDSLFRSMKLQIKYLRSLEESHRVRRACLAYLQNWYSSFYLERPEIVAEMQGLAAELRGHLEEPSLRWKFAWMKPPFGWKTANWAQTELPQFKASIFRHCDKAIYRLEGLGLRYPPAQRLNQMPCRR